MDITKLRPTPLSHLAKEKVIADFFPSFIDEDWSDDLQSMSSHEAAIHAGAFCLYATTLMTKVHETSPLDLEPYCDERVSKLKELVKNKPKFANLSDEQLNIFVQNLIAKDIRNCFAHGNFEISFDQYTKKIYFVLHPQRLDFVTDEPIVISKNSLFAANKKFIQQKGQSLSFLPPQMLRNEVSRNLSTTLKGFMLPTQMLKFADYYVGNKPLHKNEVLFDQKIFSLIQYAMLATKITYEQNDYYNIFGRESNIFDTIALIRNSVAHDNYDFLDNATRISYSDNNKSLSETVEASAAKLLIVDMQKQVIKNIKDKHSPESIKSLSEKFKEIFNFFFIENDVEDIAKIPTEKQ